VTPWHRIEGSLSQGTFTSACDAQFGFSAAELPSHLEHFFQASCQRSAPSEHGRGRIFHPTSIGLLFTGEAASELEEVRDYRKTRSCCPGFPSPSLPIPAVGHDHLTIKFCESNHKSSPGSTPPSSCRCKTLPEEH
jgi:hypothetical protein